MTRDSLSKCQIRDLKIFGENLLKLRHKYRLTRQAVSDQLGVYPSTVAAWESGQSLPRTFCIKLLQELYNVDLNYLNSKHDDKQDFEEKEPIENIEVTLPVLSNNYYLSSPEKNLNKVIRMCPTIKAGLNQDVNLHKCIAYKINDLSMQNLNQNSPTFPKGAIAIIDVSINSISDISGGQFMLLCIDNLELMCRYVEQSATSYVLTPLNNKYITRTEKKKDVKLLGKVIGIYQKIEMY